MRTIKPWAPKDLALLKSSTPTSQLAALLKRSYASVNSERQRLGIKTSTPEYPTAGPNQPQSVLGVKLLPPKFGHLPLKAVNSGGWFRYGLVADTHLCCKEERLSELHTTYDLFKSEGITTVFHAGNIIDGYIQRINGESVFSSTPDGQAQYVSDNYPSRKGITTYYISGDDHESWFASGLNIGAYIQTVLEKNGRHDLRYIGHVEADVELKHPNCKSTIIRIAHPGGGSSYARSYSGQKVVESYEGGEKCDVLVLGHWHVSNYCTERNVHVISMPSFKDQDIFSRKKRLRSEVGSAIMNFKTSPVDGSVTRFQVEFQRYYTRGYYKKFIRSDATLAKGHLIIEK